MSMDIEDLNKSQIILLTLLVSFVTSIATGIVTVSLMQKAPKDVVRVMQRVVERTVEKVESAKPSKDPKPTEKIIEKTIVVKEGDLIAQAIAENRGKVLKIINADDASFLTFALSLNGVYIVSDAKVLEKSPNLQVRDAKGQNQNIEIVKSGGARGLALFKLKEAGKKLPTLSLSEGAVKLGQSLFTFSDPTLRKVKQAIVSSNENSLIFADINTSEILPGMLIFNSNGKLLGMSTEASRKTDPQAFVSSSAISAFESVKTQENPEDPKDDDNDIQGQSQEQNASSTSASSTAKVSSNANEQKASAASAGEALDKGKQAPSINQ